MPPRKKKEEAPNPIGALVSRPYVRIVDAAVTAALSLIVQGKEPTVPEVWRLARTDEDECEAPQFFAAVLDMPVYQRVLELRITRLAPQAVKDVPFLRELCREIAQLAGDALVEDLLLRPATVDASEKRRIAHDFGNLYRQLDPKAALGDGKVAEEEDRPQTTKTTNEELKERLARMPESLRERALRQWRLDGVRALMEKEEEVRGGSATG